MHSGFTDAEVHKRFNRFSAVSSAPNFREKTIPNLAGRVLGLAAFTQRAPTDYPSGRAKHYCKFKFSSRVGLTVTDCSFDEIPRVDLRIRSPRQMLYNTKVRSIAMDVACVGVLKLAECESICF